MRGIKIAANDEFTEKLKKFKEILSEFKEKMMYGAVSYLVRASRNSAKYAEKKGLFVIEAAGDEIIKNAPGFQPKVFVP